MSEQFLSRRIADCVAFNQGKPSMPEWLHVLAIASLAAGAVCALVVAVDVLRYPQHTWIMNIVWPVTALFGVVLCTWFYFRHGRQTQGKKMGTEVPFPIAVAKGALHCGAGCTLGDIVAEWLAVLAPAVAVAFGWHSIFPDKIFAVWVIDYLLAFAFGIAFQYFTIAPMRGLSVGQGLLVALKADTLSLTAWQAGMYGFMAFAYFFLFGTLLDVHLEASSPEFWFMMQFGMLAGFCTSFPINWWLVRAGLKERM